MPRPGHFTPRKETWYPLHRRVGRPQGRSGRVGKISPTLGFDPQTVQPVASRYIEYAVVACKSVNICLMLSGRLLYSYISLKALVMAGNLSRTVVLQIVWLAAIHVKIFFCVSVLSDVHIFYVHINLQIPYQYFVIL
jgi:hypothetical protein